MVLTLAGLLLVHPASAQNVPVSGLYEISGGTFSRCCGFAGIPTDFSLPDEGQAYVRLVVDRASGRASLAILGEDGKTVFTVNPCLVPGPAAFSFENGLIQGEQLVFQGSSLSPPVSYDYTVKPSGTSLRIDGALRVTRPNCADIPTQFSHTNVMARLLPGPRLTLLERSAAGTRLMVQGRAGWTDVTEASTDLIHWTPISTNVMDYTLCPICPFAIVEDSASAKLTSRFYRAVENR
jgi:hypothetical protein